MMMLQQGILITFGVKYKYLCIMNLSIKLALELYITVVMCWLIRSTGDTTVSRKTVVNRLFFWTAEVGLLNSFCGFLLLLLIVTRSDMIWMFFYSTSSRVYANSWFAMFKGRAGILEPEPASSSRNSNDRFFGPVSIMTRVTATTEDHLGFGERLSMRAVESRSSYDIQSLQIKSQQSLTAS
ncbi:hypothetical protein BDV98DRAFT_608818 [Pterulicium gracile]|uniref:DUF6534 domain-containing protein n=1 Tax=Pterulicium gracile TaxID=1884261 RepID=A0A5C3Q1B0_9AGAR|nr:hypothetical protein BDV98DRAFT_608818 [Pterula gracilis]